jgi:Spy/CpxP family protein refolding chaperone
MIGVAYNGRLRRLSGTALAFAMVVGMWLGATPHLSAAGQSGRGGGYRHGPASVDMKVKNLTRRLDLNPHQQAAVKTILQGEQQQYANLLRNPSLSAVDRFNRLRALRESTVSQIKSVLDKDQQSKYDQLRHSAQSDKSPAQPKNEAKDQ